MKATNYVLVSVLAAGMGIVGCSKKGDECKSYVETLNPSVERLNKANSAPAETADAIVKKSAEIGKIGDETATAFGKLTFTVPELQALSTEYQSMLKEMSGAAKETESAFKVFADVSKKAESVPAELKAAGEKLKKACDEDKEADDADECKTIAERISALPSDPTKASELTSFADDLDKMGIKQAELKAAVADVSKIFRNLGKMWADASNAEKKAKSASDKEDAAIKKQNAIVEKLNKFCQ